MSRVNLFIVLLILVAGAANVFARELDVYDPSVPVLWKNLNTPGDGAYDFAINPSDPANIFVATADAQFPVIFTRNSGNTWITSAAGFPFPVNATAIAIDPSNTEQVYAGLSNGKIYRSLDRGETWAEQSTGITGSSAISEVVVHPTKPNIILAGSSAGIPYIYRSENFGETWSSIPLTGPNNRRVSQIYFSPSASDQIFAVVADEGVFTSSNDGIMWQNSGYQAISLAIDPSNPQIVYRLTSCSLFRSQNGGSTWTDIPTPEPCYEKVYIEPQQPNVLYLTSASRAVTRSTDSGANWTKLERTVTGNPLNVSAVFALDPQEPSRIYVYGRSQNASGMYTAVYLNKQLYLPIFRR